MLSSEYASKVPDLQPGIPHCAVKQSNVPNFEELEKSHVIGPAVTLTLGHSVTGPKQTNAVACLSREGTLSHSRSLNVGVHVKSGGSLPEDRSHTGSINGSSVIATELTTKPGKSLWSRETESELGFCGPEIGKVSEKSRNHIRESQHGLPHSHIGRRVFLQHQCHTSITSTQSGTLHPSDLSRLSSDGSFHVSHLEGGADDENLSISNSTALVHPEVNYQHQSPPRTNKLLRGKQNKSINPHNYEHSDKHKGLSWQRYKATRESHWSRRRVDNTDNEFEQRMLIPAKGKLVGGHESMQSPDSVDNHMNQQDPIEISDASINAFITGQSSIVDDINDGAMYRFPHQSTSNEFFAAAHDEYENGATERVLISTMPADGKYSQVSDSLERHPPDEMFQGHREEVPIIAPIKSQPQELNISSYLYQESKCRRMLYKDDIVFPSTPAEDSQELSATDEQILYTTSFHNGASMDHDAALGVLDIEEGYADHVYQESSTPESVSARIEYPGSPVESLPYSSDRDRLPPTYDQLIHERHRPERPMISTSENNILPDRFEGFQRSSPAEVENLARQSSPQYQSESDRDLLSADIHSTRFHVTNSLDSIIGIGTNRQDQLGAIRESYSQKPFESPIKPQDFADRYSERLPSVSLHNNHGRTVFSNASRLGFQSSTDFTNCHDQVHDLLMSGPSFPFSKTSHFAEKLSHDSGLWNSKSGEPSVTSNYLLPQSTSGFIAEPYQGVASSSQGQQPLDSFSSFMTAQQTFSLNTRMSSVERTSLQTASLRSLNHGVDDTYRNSNLVTEENEHHSLSRSAYPLVIASGDSEGTIDEEEQLRLSSYHRHQGLGASCHYRHHQHQQHLDNERLQSSHHDSLRVQSRMEDTQVHSNRPVLSTISSLKTKDLHTLSETSSHVSSRMSSGSDCTQTLCNHSVSSKISPVRRSLFRDGEMKGQNWRETISQDEAVDVTEDTEMHLSDLQESSRPGVSRYTGRRALRTPQVRSKTGSPGQSTGSSPRQVTSILWVIKLLDLLHNNPLDRQELLVAKAYWFRKWLRYVRLQKMIRQEENNKWRSAVMYHEVSLQQRCVKQWLTVVQSRYHSARLCYQRRLLRKGFTAFRFAVMQSKVQAKQLEARLRFMMLAKCFSKWKRLTQLRTEREALLDQLACHHVTVKAFRVWKEGYQMQQRTGIAELHYQVCLLSKCLDHWKLHVAMARRSFCQREMARVFHQDTVMKRTWVTMTTVYAERLKAKRLYRRCTLTRAWRAWKHGIQIAKMENLHDNSKAVVFRHQATQRGFFVEWREKAKLSSLKRKRDNRRIRQAFILWRLKLQRRLILNRILDSKANKSLKRRVFQAWRDRTRQIRESREEASRIIRRVQIKVVIGAWHRWTCTSIQMRKQMEHHTSERGLKSKRDIFCLWKLKWKRKKAVNEGMERWSVRCVQQAVWKWKHRVRLTRLDYESVQFIKAAECSLLKRSFFVWLEAKQQTDTNRHRAEEAQHVIARSQLHRTLLAWQLEMMECRAVGPLVDRRKKRCLGRVFDGWREIVLRKKVEQKFSKQMKVKSLATAFQYWRGRTETQQETRRQEEVIQASLVRSCFSAWCRLHQREKVGKHVTKQHDARCLSDAFASWKSQMEEAETQRENLEGHEKRNLVLQKVFFEAWQRASQKRTELNEERCRLIQYQHDRAIVTAMWTRWKTSLELELKARELEERLDQHLIHRTFTAWRKYTRASMQEAVDVFLQRLDTSSLSQDSPTLKASLQSPPLVASATSPSLSGLSSSSSPSTSAASALSLAMSSTLPAHSSPSASHLHGNHSPCLPGVTPSPIKDLLMSTSASSPSAAAEFSSPLSTLPAPLPFGAASSSPHFDDNHSPSQPETTPSPLRDLHASSLSSPPFTGSAKFPKDLICVRSNDAVCDVSSASSSSILSFEESVTIVTSLSDHFSNVSSPVACHGTTPSPLQDLTSLRHQDMHTTSNGSLLTLHQFDSNTDLHMALNLPSTPPVQTTPHLDESPNLHTALYTTDLQTALPEEIEVRGHWEESREGSVSSLGRGQTFSIQSVDSTSTPTLSPPGRSSVADSGYYGNGQMFLGYYGNGHDILHSGGESQLESATSVSTCTSVRSVHNGVIDSQNLQRLPHLKNNNSTTNAIAPAIQNGHQRSDHSDVSNSGRSSTSGHPHGEESVCKSEESDCSDASQSRRSINTSGFIHDEDSEGESEKIDYSRDQIPKRNGTYEVAQEEEEESICDSEVECQFLDDLSIPTDGINDGFPSLPAQHRNDQEDGAIIATSLTNETSHNQSNGIPRLSIKATQLNDSNQTQHSHNESHSINMSSEDTHHQFNCIQHVSSTATLSEACGLYLSSAATHNQSNGLLQVSSRTAYGHCECSSLDVSMASTHNHSSSSSMNSSSRAIYNHLESVIVDKKAYLTSVILRMKLWPASAVFYQWLQYTRTRRQHRTQAVALKHRRDHLALHAAFSHWKQAFQNCNKATSHSRKRLLQKCLRQWCRLKALNQQEAECEQVDLQACLVWAWNQWKQQFLESQYPIGQVPSWTVHIIQSRKSTQMCLAFQERIRIKNLRECLSFWALRHEQLKQVDRYRQQVVLKRCLHAWLEWSKEKRWREEAARDMLVRRRKRMAFEHWKARLHKEEMILSHYHGAAHSHLCVIVRAWHEWAAASSKLHLSHQAVMIRWQAGLLRQTWADWREAAEKTRHARMTHDRKVISRSFSGWRASIQRAKQHKISLCNIQSSKNHSVLLATFSLWRHAFYVRRFSAAHRERENRRVMTVTMATWKEAVEEKRREKEEQRTLLMEAFCTWKEHHAISRRRKQLAMSAATKWRHLVRRSNMLEETLALHQAAVKERCRKQSFMAWQRMLEGVLQADCYYNTTLLKKCLLALKSLHDNSQKQLLVQQEYQLKKERAVLAECFMKWRNKYSNTVTLHRSASKVKGRKDIKLLGKAFQLWQHRLEERQVEKDYQQKLVAKVWHTWITAKNQQQLVKAMRKSHEDRLVGKCFQALRTWARDRSGRRIVLQCVLSRKSHFTLKATFGVWQEETNKMTLARQHYNTHLQSKLLLGWIRFKHRQKSLLTTRCSVTAKVSRRVLQQAFTHWKAAFTSARDLELRLAALVKKKDKLLVARSFECWREAALERKATKHWEKSMMQSVVGRWKDRLEMKRLQAQYEKDLEELAILHRQQRLKRKFFREWKSFHEDVQKEKRQRYLEMKYGVIWKRLVCQRLMAKAMAKYRVLELCWRTWRRAFVQGQVSKKMVKQDDHALLLKAFQGWHKYSSDMKNGACHVSPTYII